MFICVSFVVFCWVVSKREENHNSCCKCDHASQSLAGRLLCKNMNKVLAKASVQCPQHGIPWQTELRFSIIPRTATDHPFVTDHPTFSPPFLIIFKALTRCNREYAKRANYRKICNTSKQDSSSINLNVYICFIFCSYRNATKNNLDTIVAANATTPHKARLEGYGTIICPIQGTNLSLFG